MSRTTRRWVVRFLARITHPAFSRTAGDLRGLGMGSERAEVSSGGALGGIRLGRDLPLGLFDERGGVVCSRRILRS